MAHRLPLLGALVLSFSVLAACDAPGLTSKAKSPAPQAATGQTRTTSAGMSNVRTMGDGPQKPTVYTPGLSVSDLIAQACGITPREVGKSVAPNFDYDSAALGEADREMLGEVAKCLTEGALKGRAVALIGRTDARGEPEYNMTLGGSRSHAVQRYMIDLGVGKDRLRATSRGEMDANGTNDEGYALDRRVDIELAL